MIAINSGSTSPASYNGVQYQADRFSDGGLTNSTRDPIAGVAEDALFQTERYGAFKYEVPVSAASYSVSLHFVELYWTASGRRSFDLTVEGTRVRSELDLYSEVGHDGALTLEVNNVRVTDGYLTIELETLVDNGTISGFAIYSVDGKLVTPPPPAPGDNGVASAENTGADCAVSALPEVGQLSSVAKLPDPFTKLNGQRISAKSDWRCRRAEINAQLQKYESGEKPPKPANVSGTVSNSSISVTVQHQGKSISFSASVTLPSNGRAPYPAMIGVGGSNLNNSYLTSQGVALINFNNNDMGAQSGGNSRGTGKFFDLYGRNHSASSMTAWAWGISRLIDVIEASGGNVIDAKRIGVTGCSRNGKGALMAGALDERIALTVPQESGAGGAASWRVAQQLANQGVEVQTLSSAAGEQPWFTASFGQNFGGNNVTRLPIDHHQVMGMVAPRGLLIIDNNIGWLGPLPGFIATSAAKEIYKALGAGANIAYSENGGHSHCQFPSHQQDVLAAYVQKFLLNGTGNTDVMRSTQGNSGDVRNWVEWTTPTLR